MIESHSVWVRRAGLGVAICAMTGCANRPPPVDYTAFQNAKPVTVLVLPPLNESPDIKAVPGVWSQVTQPLAEAGYYVLPVNLVDETLKQNGVHTSAEAQEIPPEKLREVFKADSAIYMKVARYGTSYQVLSSVTQAAIEAKWVDLRTGDTLWQGRAAASSAEQSQNQGGLAVMLVSALVKQVANTATDAAYTYAGMANQRMFATPQYNGILPGPRSPRYGQPMPQQ